LLDQKVAKNQDWFWLPWFSKNPPSHRTQAVTPEWVSGWRASWVPTHCPSHGWFLKILRKPK